MKMIAKTLLILSVLAVALGALAFTWMSMNLKQSGALSLVRQNLASDRRAVSSEINQVVMDGPFDLVIAKSDQAGMTVQGEARLLPRVLVQQEGNVLHITTKGMLVTMNQTLKINLMLPALTAVTQTGSGDIAVQGFAGDALKINLTGSGDLTYAGQYLHTAIENHGSGEMKLDLGTGDRVDLNSSGSGDIEMVGKVNLLNAVLTGSGNVDAQRLISSQTEAALHGSGNLKVYASKQLNVISTGGGDVDVFGNPVKKVINTTGSGAVNLN